MLRILSGGMTPVPCPLSPGLLLGRVLLLRSLGRRSLQA